jgi:hypothetical protein
LLPREFGWLSCAVVNLLPPQAVTNFVVFFSFPEICGRKDATASSDIVIALRAVSPIFYTPTIWPTFGWLLHPLIQQKPSKSEASSPSHFYFFHTPFVA